MKSANHLAGAGFVLLLTALLTGCASVQAPLPPSLQLPKPPTDLRAVRKGERVYLFWTLPSLTTDRQNIRHPGPTRICRSLEALMSDCGTPVGNEDWPRQAKFPNTGLQAMFVDRLPPELQQNSNRLMTYAVEALNLDARSAGLSNQVHVPLAVTFPPPSNFHAAVTVDGVELSWDCSPTDPSDASHFYRIYRRSSENGVDLKLADVECNGGRYRDRSIEWGKNYEYRITVLTSAKIAGPEAPCTNPPQGPDTRQDCSVFTVEGDDSPPQKIFTNDVYPPGVPSGLQAVFSGPGQAAFIDLLWAPVTDADLAGYNVYRREESGTPVKVNHDLVNAPAFRDAKVAAGKTYWYSVTAVDERGNESARSEEASETVPQP